MSEENKKALVKANDEKKLPTKTENKDNIIDAEATQSISIGAAARNGSSSIEDPRKIIRQGLIIIALFFGVLGIWATFGTISGAVVAPGKVKIDTERKTIQHLEGGIVESILVREGDDVVAGQTVIVLESVQVDAAVNMHSKQLVALLAAQARARAEKDLQSSITWPEELIPLARQFQALDLIENEVKIFSTRQDAYQGQVSMLKSQIAQIDAQVSGLEEQVKAEQAVVKTLEEELAAKRQLFAERYLEKSQILELERMLATHMGSRGHLRQAIAEAKQKRNETSMRIDDLTNRFVEEATANLGKLDNEIDKTREQLRPLRNAKTRLNVITPVSGKVVGLQVHSKGGVVRSGEPLMDIVPADNPLIVELHVPVNNITDVFIGQDAQVQLDAFDIRMTPLLKAKVTYISADRMEEKTISGTMPYYLCYVEIDPEALKDADVYLSPGMPATAFITTKDRTVLNYMLEPLLKNWERALRD